MSRLPDPILSGYTRDYQIDYLTAMRKVEPTSPGERQLLCWVVPPWQRDVVWTQAQQTRFIEGIFLGLGTGYYVVHGADWSSDGAQKRMSGWLIDGQQRLTAIDRFVRGEIAVFGDIRYNDLDIATKRRRFLAVKFPCVEMPYQEDERALKQLYERLCFGGTAHTANDLARLGDEFAPRHRDNEGPSP